MAGLIVDYGLECWRALCEAAPFMLFGFFVAGMLKAFVPAGLLARHLGGRGPLSVVKAAILGVPLPLCSCGVIPAALGMQRQGVGPGATAAFMIATPETGADSLAITWAMIDPLMTGLRPLAALVTACLAGIAVNLLPERLLHRKASAAPRTAPHEAGCDCCRGEACPEPRPAGPWVRLRRGFADAFGDMLADVGGWLLVGILLAGAIGLAVPPNFFGRLPGGEFSSMLFMLLVGVPLYVCASSSTPIAASFILKGLSPGAALVFLLTGPATNVTTLTVMARGFGPAFTVVYVLSIVACALGFGFLANAAYTALGVNIHAVLGGAAEPLPGWFAAASAVLLLLLIARAFLAARRGGCACD